MVLALDSYSRPVSGTLISFVVFVGSSVHRNFSTPTLLTHHATRINREKSSLANSNACYQSLN